MWKGFIKIAVAVIFATLAVSASAYTAYAQTIVSASDAAVSATDTAAIELPESETSCGEDTAQSVESIYAAVDTPVNDAPCDEENLDENGMPDSENEATESTPSAQEGWLTLSGESVYYVNGVIQTGVVTVDGLTYYVGDGSFEPINDWKEVGGKRYFFEAGIAVTGRYSVDGKPCFFDEDGVCCEYDGWHELYDERTGETERYFFVDGVASVGLVNIGGAVYYFDEQGRLTSYNGWKTIWNNLLNSESTCYFKDGRVLTGVQTIDSEKYFFTDTGVLAEDSWYDTDEGRFYVVGGKAQTGFVRSGGRIYYLGEDGKFEPYDGWKTIDGGRYLLSGGVLRTGLAAADGASYYLDEALNGRMIRGFITANGSTYYADSEGKLQTGLYSISGKSYYFGGNYAAVSGWMTVGLSKYYFGGEGYALTGWFTDGGYYYYGGADGAILTNCTVDGHKLDDQGRRVMSELEAKVVQIIDDCTNDNMSQIEKLKACYNWVIKNCSYKRDYADPTKLASGWTEKFALEMLKDNKGNCYRYASAVAYLAEGLGYDASVVTGKIVAVGGGMTPHGWAEVKIDGKTYLFDANMDDSKGKFVCFQKTYANFPYRISKGKTYNVKF